MKVEINRRELDVRDEITTLAELLKTENLSGPGQAVAVDGAVVRRADWDVFPLREGLKITVIRAVCGG